MSCFTASPTSIQGASIRLWIISICLLIGAPITQSAYALPFIDVGPKVLTGFGVLGPENSSLKLYGGGIAARFKLPFVALEVNTLYLSSQYTYGSGITASESSFGSISVPILFRASLLPLPIVDLSLGAGYERRFYVGDHVEDNYSDLIPIAISGDFSIPVIGTAGVEARFNYSLEDTDKPTHEVMLLAHLLF